MDKVAGDRNAATEDLDVFAVVTVEPIYGPPAQIRQPIEPVRRYF
jgi:hypothetical protein